jgi:pseudouridine synthase
MTEIRLNKYLASSGIASRRGADILINEGRVSINGEQVVQISVKVNPETDVIEVDGQRVKPVDRMHYILLNKPAGYVTTKKDELGRVTVMDILPEKYFRDGVSPVGRLDKDTEGLLLLTNDGELANRLTHPRFKVEKEYHVDLDKPLKSTDASKIKRGIFIHQVKSRTAPCEIEYLNKDKTRVKMTIAEGKKRQIRYTFEKFGYTVVNLKRTALGPLRIEGVNRGSHRSLRPAEVKELKKFAEAGAAASAKRSSRSSAAKKTAASRPASSAKPSPAPQPKKKPSPPAAAKKKNSAPAAAAQKKRPAPAVPVKKKRPSAT